MLVVRTDVDRLVQTFIRGNVRHVAFLLSSTITCIKNVKSFFLSREITKLQFRRPTLHKQIEDEAIFLMQKRLEHF
jgi:hypothetical protein